MSLFLIDTITNRGKGLFTLNPPCFGNSSFHASALVISEIREVITIITSPLIVVQGRTFSSLFGSRIETFWIALRLEDRYVHMLPSSFLLSSKSISVGLCHL